jgi:hypothetical protein
MNIIPIMTVDTTASMTATCPLRLDATRHIGASQGIAASALSDNATPIINNITRDPFMDALLI